MVKFKIISKIDVRTTILVQAAIHFFLTVLEARRSKVKMLGDSGFGKDSLPSLWTATPLLYPQMAGREGTLVSSS